MEISPTRAAFRDAVAVIERYAADAADRVPAFMVPTRLLAGPERPPLPAGVATKSVTPSGGLTVADALRAMQEGAVSAVEVARQCLAAMARRNADLNAFVYALPEEELLTQAEAADRERTAGRVRGPLHGIPISVKDVIAVEGMPNTASSKVLAGNVAQEDAGAVRLLKEAGAIITGKTHTHEFALGVTTPQSRNPWDPARDPGGSSGGSAVSVATGMSLASLGTDTRASIRVPSALCGLVGFKPTFGVVPTSGVTYLSWSLDHVGPMAQNVEDAALLLNVLAPTEKKIDYTSCIGKSVKGMRIGLPIASLQDADPGVAAAFQSAVTAYRDAGATVEEIDTPSAEDFTLANCTGLIVSRCEAANYHAAFHADPSLYSAPVFDQLDEASKVPAVLYLQAQRFRDAFRQRMLELLKRFDALLMPTCKVPAPKREEAERYLLVLSLNCIAWSFIGFPVVSIPCGLTPEGLPVGAQLVAGPMEERRLISLASGLEAGLQTASQWPAVRL